MTIRLRRSSPSPKKSAQGSSPDLARHTFSDGGPAFIDSRSASFPPPAGSASHARSPPPLLAPLPFAKTTSGLDYKRDHTSNDWKSTHHTAVADIRPR